MKMNPVSGLTELEYWADMGEDIEDLGILKMRLENMVVCYGEGSADLSLFFRSLAQITSMLGQYWSDIASVAGYLRDMYAESEPLLRSREPHDAA